MIPDEPETPPENHMNGAPPSSPDPEPLPEEELEGMPGNVAELCASCVRFVAAKYGVPLDFTPDTLSIVDQYVRDARAEVMAKPMSLPLVEASVGAYVGEVIRRVHHGLWRADGDHDTWRIQMTRVYLTFNPIGMAREAILLGAADGWHAHLEMDEVEREEVQRRLAALPEASEDEFYAPSTRFDVVELAVESIAAQMRSRGLGDVRFTADDYEKSR